VDNICVWSNGKRKELLRLEGQHIADPVYAASGHVLFTRAPGTPGVWALPFSLASLAVTGKPFLVAAGGISPRVSNDNTLAYVAADAINSTQMVWADATGKELGTIGDAEVGAVNMLALSPEGRRVARPVRTGEDREIWVYDATRGTRSRLTFSESEDDTPVWSLDGARIAYHHHTKGEPGYEGYSLLVRAADGTGRVDTVADLVAPNFVPDGRHLTAIRLLETGSKWDLMEVPLDRSSSPRMLVQGNPRAMEGRVSPKGDVMAYMSEESGEWEVYLTRYPACEGKWQVSVAGGQWPRWSTNGDRLFFAQAEDIMVVDVSGAGSPTLTTPRRLFTRQNLGTGSFRWYPYFDVTGDGSRFVVLRGAGAAERPKGVAIVQGWVEEFATGRAAGR
jgi:serine/threonine-protein kinase